MFISTLPSIPPIGILAVTDADSSVISRIQQFFADGGFCMYLLAFCSLALVATIIFKFLTLRTSLVISPTLTAGIRTMESNAAAPPPAGFLKEVEDRRTVLARLCAVAWRRRGESRERISEAVQTAAKEEIHHLHSGMAAIDAIGSLAPLLGLLGMASGLVVMFGGLGENPDPTAVSRGISEALNTTVLGLGLAVPSIVFHTFFSRRLDHHVARLELLLSTFAIRCERTSTATQDPAVQP